jgi:hypothetical protein
MQDLAISPLCWEAGGFQHRPPQQTLEELLEPLKSLVSSMASRPTAASRSEDFQLRPTRQTK